MHKTLGLASSIGEELILIKKCLNGVKKMIIYFIRILQSNRKVLWFSSGKINETY